MSRLCAWLESDRVETERTIRGHQIIALRVNYGTKEVSKIAVRVRVEMKEGEDKPKVYVYPMEGISVKICDVY